MHVRFCKDDFELPSPALNRLRRSEDLVDDLSALRSRLAEDGYLFLKGVLDREQVLRARATLLNYLAEHEGLEPGSRPLDGVMGEYGKSVPLHGRRAITHHPDLRAVLESPDRKSVV